MYYVYILKSVRENLFYTGYTNNLARRIKEHDAGNNPSTKHMRPLKLVYQEKHNDKETARKRELYWKSGIGREKRDKLFGNLRGVEQSGSSSGS